VLCPLEAAIQERRGEDTSGLGGPRQAGPQPGLWPQGEPHWALSIEIYWRCWIVSKPWRCSEVGSLCNNHFLKPVGVLGEDQEPNGSQKTIAPFLPGTI
jgi:hypothetical protein